MVKRGKSLRGLLALFIFFTLAQAGVAAQKGQSKPGPTTGTVKGRVRVAQGSAADISVTLHEGEREVARTRTNGRGEFELGGIAPGSYGLTLRKPGLQVGKMENVEVRAGRVASLKDGLFLPVDEGSLAFLRGSVFDVDGRSVFGAKVELAQIAPDGKLKKVADRVTNEVGSFTFRLPPDAARYRLTARADGMEPVTREVEVDGAAVFRVALTLARSR